MKIAIFVGHPRAHSFSHALAARYAESAEKAGAQTRQMTVDTMSFDMDLTHGYVQRKDLEPCLEQWRQDILWADHLAWFYPLWWGGMPAKMKGVIDRAFLPRFAMNYIEQPPFWKSLLDGRSADVFITADSPGYWDILRNGSPGRKQVKNRILEFSGIKPVKIHHLAAIKRSSAKDRERWLNLAEKAGAKIASRKIA